MRAKLTTFERGAVQPVWQGRAQRIDLWRQDAAGNVGRLQSTLASYAGHLRHGATWQVWAELWERYPWLDALFVRHGWRMEERWSAHRIVRARGFAAQYRQIVRHAGDDCLVFCQVGRFIEFYGPQRMAATPVLRLNPTVLPRAGYAFAAGFPVHLSTVYTVRALRQGLSVVEVRQAPATLGRDCVSRLPWTVLIPRPA